MPKPSPCPLARTGIRHAQACCKLRRTPRWPQQATFHLSFPLPGRGGGGGVQGRACGSGLRPTPQGLSPTPQGLSPAAPTVFQQVSY